MHWRRKWQPLQCSCLENPRDGGAWWAAVYGITQSQTRLKRLNSSSGRVMGGATEYASSSRTVHQRVHSVVSPVTCDTGSQSTQFHLNRGNAVGPGVPLELYSQSHQHRSVGAAPLKSGTRTAVVVHLDLLCELWKQPRPRPTPACMCLPAKPTATNVRTAQAMGAPIVRSDVLQH